MIRLSSPQRLGFPFFILLLALIGVGFRFPSFFWSWLGEASLTTNFLLSIGIMTLLILGIGYAINGQMFGILIDQRNKISLSRFQLVIWSLLVICSLWTAFSWNISEVYRALSGRLESPDPIVRRHGSGKLYGLGLTDFAEPEALAVSRYGPIRRSAHYHPEIRDRYPKLQERRVARPTSVRVGRKLGGYLSRRRDRKCGVTRHRKAAEFHVHHRLGGDLCGRIVHAVCRNTTRLYGP